MLGHLCLVKNVPAASRIRSAPKAPMLVRSLRNSRMREPDTTMARRMMISTSLDHAHVHDRAVENIRRLPASKCRTQFSTCCVKQYVMNFAMSPLLWNLLRRLFLAPHTDINPHETSNKLILTMCISCRLLSDSLEFNARAGFLHDDFLGNNDILTPRDLVASLTVAPRL